MPIGPELDGATLASTTIGPHATRVLHKRDSWLGRTVGPWLRQSGWCSNAPQAA